MSNTFVGLYDPIFYANETLLALRKTLGMAARVWRGPELERRSFQRGDTITLTAPGEFTATSAPAGSSQDVYTRTVNIALTNWKEVRFEVRDDQIAYGSERIISDHIEPAAYALALDIDTALTGLAVDVPWAVDAQGTTSALDILNPRKSLQTRGVPLDNRVHLVIDHTMEANFLNLGIFHQAQVTGPGLNTPALLNGSLGVRFGVEVFGISTIGSHTSGTVVSAGTDVAGALTANASKGATSIAVGSLSGSQTLAAGDSLIIAGNTQRYVVTAAATLVSGAATLSVWPALVQDYASTAVVTFEDGTAVNASTYTANMCFHEHAFALAMVPLPTTGNNLGARMATVTDPLTNLSLRSTLWYDGATKKVYVSLDMLYGVRTVDPNRAVLLRSD